METNISNILLKIIGGLIVYIASIFLIFYGLILAAYFNDAIGVELIAGSIPFIIEVSIICILAITVSIIIARFIMRLLKTKKKYVGITVLVVLLLIAIGISPIPFVYILF